MLVKYALTVSVNHVALIRYVIRLETFALIALIQKIALTVRFVLVVNAFVLLINLIYNLMADVLLA
jgi:hypothetical protein